LTRGLTWLVTVNNGRLLGALVTACGVAPGRLQAKRKTTYENGGVLVCIGCMPKTPAQQNQARAASPTRAQTSPLPRKTPPTAEYSIIFRLFSCLDGPKDSLPLHRRAESVVRKRNRALPWDSPSGRTSRRQLLLRGPGCLPSRRQNNASGGSSCGPCSIFARSLTRFLFSGKTGNRRHRRRSEVSAAMGEIHSTIGRRECRLGPLTRHNRCPVRRYVRVRLMPLMMKCR